MMIFFGSNKKDASTQTIPITSDKSTYTPCNNLELVDKEKKKKSKYNLINIYLKLNDIYNNIQLLKSKNVGN